MLKPNSFLTGRLILAVLLTSVLTLFSQEPKRMQKANPGERMQQHKPMHAEHMDSLMQRMQHMMNRTEGMMHGQHGMKMHGNMHWMNMLEGSEKTIRNMSQMMQQLDMMMANEDVMADKEMKEHLDNMKKNMTSMMQSMHTFLDNAEAIQGMEKTGKIRK